MADCLAEWTSVIIYGWLVQHKANLAVPLVFHFIGECLSLVANLSCL